MKQEGMTFDHDFCYFILLFSSLLKKEGRERENEVAKIVIKSHTFLFHRNKGSKNYDKFFFRTIKIKQESIKTKKKLCKYLREKNFCILTFKTKKEYTFTLDS